MGIRLKSESRIDSLFMVTEMEPMQNLLCNVIRLELNRSMIDYKIEFINWSLEFP